MKKPPKKKTDLSKKKPAPNEAKSSPQVTHAVPTTEEVLEEKRVTVQEISNYQGREIIAKYAAQGTPQLSVTAQLAILARCDPEHPRYDKKFADITYAQARVLEPEKKREFKSFVVELDQDGFDPQAIKLSATGQAYYLIADSPGFSLYQHEKRKGGDLLIVNAKTRNCSQWRYEGDEPHPPLDAKAWEFM